MLKIDPALIFNQCYFLLQFEKRFRGMQQSRWQWIHRTTLRRIKWIRVSVKKPDALKDIILMVDVIFCPFLLSFMRCLNLLLFVLFDLVVFSVAFILHFDLLLVLFSPFLCDFGLIFL